MARPTGKGGRHAKQKPDGVLAPQPTSLRAEPFSDNQEAYAEALRLLDDLRKLRGPYHVRVDEPYADSLAFAYYKRLRASGWVISLFTVLNTGRLDVPRLVFILHVLAGWFGHIQMPFLRDALALAVGFEPVRARILCDWAKRERKLLFIDEKGLVLPTRTLVDLASKASPISDRETLSFKKQLMDWPTKHGVEDGNEKGGKES